MISDSERTRLKKLFSDTISLLCRSGLPGGAALRVDALIGVTLDDSEIVLVNVNENFRLENEHTDRKEAEDEKCGDMQAIQLPEKFVTPDERCNIASADNEGSSHLAIEPDVNDGKVNVALTCLGDSADNSVPLTLHRDLHMKSSNEDHSMTDIFVPQSEKTSPIAADGDCVVIKTELKEEGPEINNMQCENESGNFPVASLSLVSETTMTPMAAVHRSLYSTSPLRLRHLHSIQRHARRLTSGTKFIRPQDDRNNPIEQSLLNQSQVLPYVNDGVPMLQLDSGTDNQSACPKPSSDIPCREVLQCYVCGAWLRGRQTLNEHIRGRHFSIYNYHCKYCGLSFKWRSAHRNHQLSCCVSQQQRT